MTCQPNQTPEPSVDDRRQVLESMYPGWVIACLASGRWYASRRAEVTDAQADAGVVAGFWRDSFEGFVDQLAQQAELVDQCGGHSPP